MLATSNGQLWLISTPNGRTGFFYDTWAGNDEKWMRVSVPATQCPRIEAGFLEDEQRYLTNHKYRQEYLCEFIDAEDSFFSTHLIEAALDDNTPVMKFDGPSLKWRNDVQEPNYYIGVDLGQVQNYTAVAILERALKITGPRNPATYEYPYRILHSLRYLERIQLGTSYEEIANYVRGLVVHPLLSHAPRQIIVDATGVGRPVVEILRRVLDRCDVRIPIISVMITSGQQQTNKYNEYHIPRNDLLMHLELSFQNEQLKIAKDLPDVQKLTRELQNLRRRSPDSLITSNRSTVHDDMVFAAALAVWRAASTPQPRLN